MIFEVFGCMAQLFVSLSTHTGDYTVMINSQYSYTNNRCHNTIIQTTQIKLSGLLQKISLFKISLTHYSHLGWVLSANCLAMVLTN